MGTTVKWDVYESRAVVKMANFSVFMEVTGTIWNIQIRVRGGGAGEPLAQASGKSKSHELAKNAAVASANLLLKLQVEKSPERVDAVNQNQ